MYPADRDDFVPKLRLATDDGFEVARQDLELRGPGEVLGTRQTGMLQFRVADLATVGGRPILDALVMLQDRIQKREGWSQRAIAEERAAADLRELEDRTCLPGDLLAREREVVLVRFRRDGGQFFPESF